MASCPGRARHWRIAIGTVGLRTPVCCYCGSPNPKPLKEWEWAELIDWAAHRIQPRPVRDAIKVYQDDRAVA